MFKNHSNNLLKVFFIVLFSFVISGFFLSTKTFAQTAPPAEIQALLTADEKLQAANVPPPAVQAVTIDGKPAGPIKKIPVALDEATKKVKDNSWVAGTTGSGSRGGGSGGSGGSCGWSPSSWFTTKCISSVLSYLATTLTGGLVVLAGWLLDLSASFAINGATYNSDAIKTAWIVLRDVVNVVFIFLILYVGIQTILGLTGANTQKALARIILVALLINFSLVITGIIIDTSNVLTLGFYDAFPSTSCLTNQPLQGNSRSLSCPFAQGASLSQFMGDRAFDSYVNRSGLGGKLEAVLIFVILRLLINIVAAFVLFTAAILFMIRTGVLIFLMVLSPLAAAAWALPKTQGYAQKWLKMLLNQAFFAPIFMLLYYVSARMYLSPMYGDSFTNLGGGMLMQIILKFAITTIFLVATILVAKSLGAKGATYFADKGKSKAKKYAGAVGQNTLGRASTAIKDSDSMKNFVARHPRLLGNAALSTLNLGSKATFGGDKGGYAKRQEEGVKRNLDNLKYVEKDKHGKDLMAKEKNIREEEWVDKDGNAVSKDTPGARELLRNSAGNMITKETLADGRVVWREKNITEMHPMYDASGKVVPVEDRVRGYSQNMRTVKQQIRASDVMVEKLASQRQNDYHGFGRIFPSAWKRDGTGIRGGKKPREEIIVKEERDEDGNITQKEVRGTIGGKQTVVDRETIIKRIKDKGKTKSEKAAQTLIEEAEKKAKDDAKDNSDEGGDDNKDKPKVTLT